MGKNDRNRTRGGARRGRFARFLDFVEWLGNLLPHPVTLFALICVGVLLLSGVAGYFEWQVADPRPLGARGRAEDGIIRAVSLLNPEGLRRIGTGLVTNFTSFAPLGTVLVALLGVGVAERSGLLSISVSRSARARRLCTLPDVRNATRDRRSTPSMHPRDILRFDTPTARVRAVAFLEGVSYVVLLFAAMPLKYAAGYPLAVRIVGSLHGFLFVWLGAVVLGGMLRRRRPFGWAVRIGAASLIPFGTFFLDRELAAEDAAWRADPAS